MHKLLSRAKYFSSFSRIFFSLSRSSRCAFHDAPMLRFLFSVIQNRTSQGLRIHETLCSGLVSSCWLVLIHEFNKSSSRGISIVVPYSTSKYLKAERKVIASHAVVRIYTFGFITKLFLWSPSSPIQPSKLSEVSFPL